VGLATAGSATGCATGAGSSAKNLLSLPQNPPPFGVAAVEATTGSATGAGVAMTGAAVAGNSVATAAVSAGGRLSRAVPGSVTSGGVSMR